MHLRSQLDLPDDMHLVAMPLGPRLDLRVAVALVPQGSLDAVFVPFHQSRLVGRTQNRAQRIQEEGIFPWHGFARFHALEFHSCDPDQRPFIDEEANEEAVSATPQIFFETFDGAGQRPPQPWPRRDFGTHFGLGIPDGSVVLG